MASEIFSVIGAVLIQGGGAAAVAFMIFRFLGKSWIENKFAMTLENYRGIQAQELEKVKSKISFLLNRSIKYHDKEHELFPEVWTKLNDTCAALNQSISRLRRIPDLNRMEEIEFSAFLDSSDLDNAEKKFMKESNIKERNSSLIKVLEWRDLIIANEAFMDFHKYLQRNKIFFNLELKEKLVKIDDLIWKSFVSAKLSHEDPSSFSRSEPHKVYKDEVMPLMEEIENIVREKLLPVDLAAE